MELLDSVFLNTIQVQLFQQNLMIGSIAYISPSESQSPYLRGSWTAIRIPNTTILQDVPVKFSGVYAVTAHTQGNRPGVITINRRGKKIILVEFSRSMITNREKKEGDKTSKYTKVKKELQQRHPSYAVKQLKFVISAWWKRIEKITEVRAKKQLSHEQSE